MVAKEANSINAATTGIVGNTGTAFTGTAVTQYNVVVGGATSSTLANVTPSATSGVPLISGGSAANPSFGTAVVAGGGTGVATMTTAYAPVCAGTTATGALQVASTGLATSGFVLTSTGSSSLPSFQTVSASGAITTVDGDSGSATPSAGVITVKAGNSTQNSGSSVKFVASGAQVLLDVADASHNIIIGDSAGNPTLSGADNVGVGSSVFLALTSGGHNTCIGFETAIANTSGTANSTLGYGALFDNVTGSNNVAIGAGSLFHSVTDDNTAVGFGSLNILNGAGTQNLAFGYNSLVSLSTGSNNIGIGTSVGSAYVGAESSNILIGNSGVAAESNVLRIGTQGSGTSQQNLCFVSGITGATPTSGNTPQVVLCDNAGNLAPISSSTAGYVLTSNGTATPTFQANPGSSGFTTVNVQTFTSTGTYTPTANMSYCIIECVGGGGAGGGTANTAAGLSIGGGGGGGAYSRKFASAATIGASKTATVGAGGTPGGAGNNPGGNGGASSLGIICTANGGTGGGGSATTTGGTGGAGGTAGTGDFSIPGQTGLWGGNSGVTTILAGSVGWGGASTFGFGGFLNASTTPVAGTAGQVYGGGGSGSQSFNNGAEAGGAGAAGIVIVTEYIT